MEDLLHMYANSTILSKWKIIRNIVVEFETKVSLSDSIET